MKIRKNGYETVTKYTYEELAKMSQSQSTIELPKEKVEEDKYEKSKEPENIKYQDADGIVLFKGQQSETLENKVMTKMVLDQELAINQEETGLKKTG